MNKYVRAILFNGLFFIINTIFYLAITAIALRVMGDEFYGLWVILNAVLLFSNVGAQSLSVVVIKYISESGEKTLPPESVFNTGVILVFLMAILFVVGIILFRPLIITQLGVSAEWRTQFDLALIFSAASIFPQFLNRIPYGYLLAKLRNDLVRGIEFGVNTAIWVGVIFLAFYTRNLGWMAIWVFFIQGIGTILLYSIVSRNIKIRLNVYPKTIKKMLNFSGFYLVESLAVSLFQHFDRILTAVILGPTAAGVYSIATSVGLRLLTTTGQVTEVLLPYASRKKSLGEDLVIHDIFRQVSQVISLFAGLISSVLILWMDIFLDLWISPDYADNYNSVFRIIVFAYFIISLARSGHQTLTGMGKVRSTSKIYLGTSLLMLTGVLILAKNYGLIGAASANFIMVFLLVFNILVYQSSHIDKAAWKLLIYDNGLAIIINSLIFGLSFFQVMDYLVFRYISTLVISFIIIVCLFRKNIIRFQILNLIDGIKNRTV